MARRGVPGVGKGRPTEAQLRRTRELVERFVLLGYSTERIRETLAALKDDPIDISIPSVERHIAAVRAGWLDRVNPENEELKADLIGHYQSIVTEATQGSAAKRGTVLEIAHNKLRLAAAQQMARLAGLDTRKVEVTGPGGEPVLGPQRPHALDSIPPDALAERLRTWADALEGDTDSPDE
jgi:hypothetical protein